MKKGKQIHISRSDIEGMEKIKRLNLINHITGYKSANLIGTKSTQGYPNLSIVSSVVNLSSVPALIESIYIQNSAMKAEGQLDLTAVGTVAISGLNNYHRADQLASYAYASPGAFPTNLLQTINIPDNAI